MHRKIFHKKIPWIFGSLLFFRFFFSSEKFDDCNRANEKVKLVAICERLVYIAIAFRSSHSNYHPLKKLPQEFFPLINIIIIVGYTIMPPPVGVLSEVSQAYLVWKWVKSTQQPHSCPCNMKIKREFWFTSLFLSVALL